MDIFKGQRLRLRFDAIDISNGTDPNDSKAPVKYAAGTEVEVAKIQDDIVWLLFPDGQTIANRGLEVLQAYEKVGRDKTLTRTVKGSGTPPKGLFPLMPEGAKWEMNYGWSITVSLDELQPKVLICQDCYTELPIPTDDLQVFCEQCKTLKTPISVESILGASSPVGTIP